MSNDPFLSVRGPISDYGSTRVLQGIDFDVLHGSVVTLIGRNGADRTTTSRSIPGNVPPSEGTITFDEADITTPSSEKTAREGIALVPEERRVFPGLTVSENVEIDRIGGRRDVEKSTADAIVDELENLTCHRNSRGANLSGGEQQMLTIARASVSAPDLLLLDEPTEGLAPAVVKQVQRKTEELNDSGAAADEVLNRHLDALMADWRFSASRRPSGRGRPTRQT